MRSRILAFAFAAIAVGLFPGAALAQGPRFTPGSAGAGDPYYPKDGNGGYDVRHYDLHLKYKPKSGVLVGRAVITARATKNLSRFDLDLIGLKVRSIRVDGHAATWSRHGQELRIRPDDGIRDGRRFTVVVKYRGVPRPLFEFGGVSGFIATDDGFTIAGQPHGAAYWFPANDHPSDKASFTFFVNVPRDRQVVANGRLVETRRHGARTTWTWNAPDPMATYLATVDVGMFNMTSAAHDGIRYIDAIDPDLFAALAAPDSGTQFAYSQQADSAYKRLERTISVPAEGGALTFRVQRDTETFWDFFMVEAHHPGVDDWTTLPEASGITSDEVGFSCFAGWQDIHPFLAHYQTFEAPAEPDGEATCDPVGSTGTWNAATGASSGSEPWTIDLADYAGGDVEVALTAVSDDVVQHFGVVVDDVAWPGGETSFEDDGDTMDGWTVPGAPDGSPGNANDWAAGDASLLPPPVGDNAAEAFGQEPEVVSFLASQFGPYPWATSGGIVDDVADLGFALETQTRPVYSKDFFTTPDTGVVAHELAHQWYGDSLAVERWRHIWLNEGFATYAEWLWSEHLGLDTPQGIFDAFYDGFPDDDPFWDLRIGNPGAGSEFDFPVYARGAMTLQVLRTTVGDVDFFRIIRRWAKANAGGNVSTDDFIRLAERISGRQLDALFEAWLFTRGKPAVVAPLGRGLAAGASVPAVVRSEIQRYANGTLPHFGR